MDFLDWIKNLYKKQVISPTKIIESSEKPHIEHHFIKNRGKNIKDVTYYKGSDENKVYSVKFDESEDYTSVHTHPVQEELSEEENMRAFYSGRDLKTFFKNEKMKTMVVAVRDTKSGEVQGYHFLRKTKSTPKSYNEDDMDSYSIEKDAAEILHEPFRVKEALDDFSKKYHLIHHLIPAKNYEHNKEKTAFVKKGRLERVVANSSVAASIIALIGAIFFLSTNLTGNVIGNMTNSTLNIIGGILFVLGLIGALVYFKMRVK